MEHADRMGVQRMQKDYKSQNGWRAPRKQSPLQQQDKCTYEFTENEVAGTGPLQFFSKWHPRLKEVGNAPLLNPEAISNWQLLANVSFKEVSLEKQSTLKSSPHVQW